MRSVGLVSLATVISLNISTAHALEKNASVHSATSVPCDKDALSASVKKTGHQIRSMKQVYRIALQKQLKSLKQQKGWSKEEFIVKASGFMKNDKIESYNTKNRILLSSIASLNKNTNTDSPDCAMLHSLNNHLDEVVQNTRQKWDYMFREIKSAYKTEEK